MIALNNLYLCERIDKTKNLGEWMDGWVDGWMDGWESRVKDCLQQSKILNFDYFLKIVNFSVI